MSEAAGKQVVAPDMTVFVVGLRGFPGVQGGVETHAENLYPIIASKGVRVLCAARSPFHARSTREWRGVEFVRLWAPRSSYLEAIVHSTLAVLTAAWKRPDIVHVHAVGPGLVTPLARLLGLRVVVTHHGPDYDREKWNRVARWVLKTGEWSAMRFANERIVISKVIADMVKMRYAVPTNIIPNGVRIPVLDADKACIDAFGLEAGRYVLLVSRFVPEKRHIDLVNAFRRAELNGWKLVLVGDADHPGAYDQQVKELAASTPGVVLTGFIGGEKLKAVYQHAGIFVLPSSHEGLPIALLEALSFGLRCIASDIPANVAVGLDESAYFRLGDVDQLAARLRRLAERDTSADERDRQRSWVANRFNWDAIADQTIEVYRAALSGGAKL